MVVVEKTKGPIILRSNDFSFLSGMDVNIRRAESGCTPLMTAAQQVGKIELVKALILKGADPKLCAYNGSSLIQVTSSTA